MRISRSVAALLREHVTLELESIDRMYLNVYVPGPRGAIVRRRGGMPCAR